MLSSVTQPIVLAVSGGIDSMVLLDVTARIAHGRVARVATFDHGTGRHARAAVVFVRRAAAAFGFKTVVGRARALPASEARWREARLSFLRTAARDLGAVVATAHTEDDQLETVLMRAIRGSEARGLAALYAPSPGFVRPLLHARRADVAEYAQARGVEWAEDPTNASLRFFRNRVRRQLLPALEAHSTGFGATLLDLSRQAAGLRGELNEFVSRFAVVDTPCAQSVTVAHAALAPYDAASLALIWGTVAGQVGLALDRRGTRRVVAFTISGSQSGASIQVAGGWEVVRERSCFVLRRRGLPAPGPARLPGSGTLQWGRWRFAREPDESGGRAWRGALPGERPLTVRAWRAGDRMAAPGGHRRRVKRFLSDAGIVGPDRTGWPVVLAGEEIVWIPGAASAASHPAHTARLIYSCERNDR